MTDAQILAAVDLPFQCYDFDTPITFRQWCTTALTKLYDVEERFGGKRPFGNGGWRTYLTGPFVSAGLIVADEDGYPKDDEAAQAVIFRAIRIVTGAAPKKYRG